MRVEIPPAGTPQTGHQMTAEPLDFTPDPRDCRNCGGSGMETCVCRVCRGTGDAPKATDLNSVVEKEDE